jgi:hypothetical protein
VPNPYYVTWKGVKVELPVNSKDRPRLRAAILCHLEVVGLTLFELAEDVRQNRHKYISGWRTQVRRMVVETVQQGK